MSVFDPQSKPLAGWKRTVYGIIFEHDTRAGTIFDVTLLIAIVASIVVVMLGTVDWAQAGYGETLKIAEYFLTGLFSIEYGLRLLVVRKAGRYAWSALGLIDLLSLLPTYLAVLVGNSAGGLIVLRSLRLFRVFRLFQLGPFIRESDSLFQALVAARYKIIVFVGALLIIVTVQGAILYFVEPDTFQNLPQAVYWSIVTLTTVGYGDIAPQTGIGQGIASLLMLMGYGILAVPTGIVGVQMARVGHERSQSSPTKRVEHEAPIPVFKACFQCRRTEDDPEATFCRYCGRALEGHEGPASGRGDGEGEGEARP